MAAAFRAGYAKQQNHCDHLLLGASEVFVDTLRRGCREDLIVPDKGDQAIKLCAHPYRPICLASMVAPVRYSTR